jgi:hypothetical protein
VEIEDECMDINRAWERFIKDFEPSIMEVAEVNYK